MNLSRREWIRLLAALPCGLRSASSQAPRRYALQQTVRDAPSVFAPAAHAGPNWVTTSFLFDTLVWKDRDGVVPLLATAWEVSPDAKRWTFRLRDNVRWHDGKPLTAADVAFTLRYLAEHPVAVWSSEALRKPATIETPDDHTVRIRTNAPSPDFLEAVAGTVQILPRHIWRPISDPIKYVDSPAFIGSGPFRHLKTSRGEYTLLGANRGYFMGAPQVDQLVLKDVNNAGLALRGGGLDAAPIESPLAARQFRNDAKFAVARGPFSYYVTKLVFNVKRAPFDNRAVRQAIACALNREEMIRLAFEGDGLAASPGLLHPDSCWFAPGLPRYGLDLARTQNLLAQAGYARRAADGIRVSTGGRRLSFTLLQQSGSVELGRLAELIRRQLAAAGIQLAIQAVSVGPLEHRMSTGDFDLALDGHGGTNNLQVVASYADFPARLYHNPALDAAYRKFTAGTENNRRRESAAEVQRIIAGDVPAIPLINARQHLVYRRDKGIEWFWTKGGLGGGVPQWWNKFALLAQPNR